MRRLVAVFIVVAVVGAVSAWLLPTWLYALSVSSERSRSGLRVEEVRIGRAEIPYLVGGSGPTLVLLHGFAANKDHWVAVSRYLTPHVRLVAPDLPGFGETARELRLRYAVGDQVERVVDFLDALELEAVHLGGNSMGGAIAAELAARHPERVESLWLLAPGGVLSAAPSELAEMMLRGANPFLIHSSAGFERLLALNFFEPPEIPGWVLAVMARRTLADQPFLAKVLRDLAMHPVAIERSLVGASLPTLVVWGLEDRILHPSGGRILAGVLREVTHVEMPETGHLPMVERPGESAEDWLAFAREAGLLGSDGTSLSPQSAARGFPESPGR